MVLSWVLFQTADKVFKWISLSSHTYTILLTLFLIHYSFIWWINVEHLLCANDCLVLGKPWRLTLIQEPHRWMENGVCDRGPSSREVHRAVGALWCWILPGQGWLLWAGGVRAELCRLYQSLQSKGGLKEHSSYSISTTRPCYYCLYLLSVTFESHTYHLTFAIM